jgi:RNA 3'-terminal phosphate cyclase (ATP)
MIRIDGAAGEGGGQVLRSALALSMATGQGFRVDNIRAGRKRPGLMRHHLTAVRAAQTLCSARVEGMEIGSKQVVFEPGAVIAGDHTFSIGTAGSTTLVLQTVLPALLTAPAPSRLVLEGGTHNPLAPPFEFLAGAYVPLLNRLGPRIEVRLEKYGFAPAGGGRIVAEIEPAPLRGFELLERGELLSKRATALVSNLPRHVGERELRHVASATGWDAAAFELREVDSPGPGNVLLVELESEQVTEVLASFGEHGVRAEAVADRLVRELRRYLKAGVPVGEHLADQLLLPLALAGSGAYSTLPLSRHATTQLDLVRAFLDVPIEVKRVTEDSCVVRVG